MMKLNLLQIPDEGLEIKQDETFEMGGGETVTATLDLYVSKLDNDVIVRGTVETSEEAVCGRCLKPFRLEQSLPLDLAFFKEKSPEDAEAAEEGTLFFKGDEIDLGEAVKEQLLLNAPMRPLCSEDCKGLCPVCGADLNTEACGCKPKSGDPRMQALKDYFDKKRKD